MVYERCAFLATARSTNDVERVFGLGQSSAAADGFKQISRLCQQVAGRADDEHTDEGSVARAQERRFTTRSCFAISIGDVEGDHADQAAARDRQRADAQRENRDQGT